LVRWDDVNQPVQVYEQHSKAMKKEDQSGSRKNCVPILELHNNPVKLQVRVDFLEALLRNRFPNLNRLQKF